MDKFEKILDMIDHQDKYSDEEIRELLQDEECRKLYQTMQEVDSALLEGDLKAKTSNDNTSDSKVSPMVDIDEEWEKFSLRHHLSEDEAARNVIDIQQNAAGKSSWHKIVAAVAGLVLISGITFAAIHTYTKKSQKSQVIIKSSHVEVVVKDSTRLEAVKDSLAQVKAKKPVIHKTFENVNFEEMINEIASYYGVRITNFDGSAIKKFRFYYEWDSRSSLESVIKDLNQFENVNIELVGPVLVVR